MAFRLLFNASTLRISKQLLLLWTISWSMQSLSGQAVPFSGPPNSSPTITSPMYNTPASSWSPGSTMQPQTQNPYIVNLGRAASSYSPPNPYVRPTPQQTQWYVDNHPDLSGLPSSMKSQIVNGTNPWVLNGSYLSNGTPNPFYNNGQIIPNWYVPATWPTPGTNWVGVQPNGFLPTTNSTTYSSSFNNYHPSYSSVVTSVPHVTNFMPSSAYTQPSQVQPSSSRIQQDPDRAFFTANSVRESSGLSSLRPDTGEITRAIENSQRSLALSEAAGDKVGQVTSHATLAELFVQQGDIDHARAQIGLAEHLADRTGDSRSQIALLRTKAAISMTSSEFGEAISNYQKIISALGEPGDESEEAGAEISLGWAYQSVGDVPRALTAYEKARGLFAKSGDHDGETRVALGMGSLYQSIGEFEKASELYMHVAFKASQEQFAQMLVSVAEIYAARRLPVSALARYEKALALEGVNHDSPLGVSILTGLGRCHMALGHYAEAKRYFDEADMKALMIGDHRLEAGVLASIGELHYWMAISPPFLTSRMIPSNPAEDFHRSLVNSGRLSPAAGDSSARSVQVLVSKSDPKKNFLSALDAFNKSLVLTRAAGDRIGEIGVLTNIGLAYDAWGKHDSALGNYLAALQKLDDLQTGARLEEFRINLANQSAQLYQRAIELEVSQHHLEEAFNLTERSRARTFLDQLGNNRIDLYKDAPKDFIQQEDALRRRNIALQRQLAQEMAKPGPEMNSERIHSLQGQLSNVQREYQEAVVSLKLSNPAYSSFLSVSPLTLSEVQQHLPPDTTVVSYFTTPEMVLAFVITRKSFHVSQLPVKEEQLAEAIANFLDFSGANSESAALKSLNSWLIEPLKSHLTTTKLVLVPHGPLNGLPFAALSPDGEQYLNDSYTISYLPSVSALPYFKSKGKPGNHIVVLANDQEEGAPQLNHAYDEARAVASFGNAQLLLGNNATTSAVQSMAGNYDIVHLIGHVYVDRDYPQFSRISLGQPLERDEPLDLNRVLRLNLRQTSLVVLSGCQTQTGSRSRGDDVIALNRAFLYAGAASVIASLWSVDDDATRQLMVAFYSHLREQPDRAQALRAAQIEVRQKYPNPYYWAGFVLTGNPGESGNSDLFASSAK